VSQTPGFANYNNVKLKVEAQPLLLQSGERYGSTVPYILKPGDHITAVGPWSDIQLSTASRSPQSCQTPTRLGSTPFSVTGRCKLVC